MLKGMTGTYAIHVPYRGAAPALTDLLANQIAAAPDPATAALGKEIDRFFNTAASYGMSMAGSGGGGGMGGG